MAGWASRNRFTKLHSSRHLRILILKPAPGTLLLLSLLLTSPADAQSANCDDVLTTTLANEMWEIGLEECATEVSPALADLIEASTSEQSGPRLTLLDRLAYWIRDPVLFEAGMTLAGNTTAEPAARVIGFSVALTQVDPSLGFENPSKTR